MELIDYLILTLRIISAEFLFLGFLYISYSLARHLVGSSSIALKWCAAILILMTLTSLLFNLLITIHQFTIIAAVIALTIIILILTYFLKFNFYVIVNSISQDLAVLKKILISFKKSPFRYFFYIYFIFIIFIGLRTLILPMLGWDSLTYHAFKAGLWVQNHGPLTMNAPGGWAMALTMFGGGDAFIAWMMLPFHNDLLASMVDVIAWLSMGLALYTLAKEFEIKPIFRWIAAFYVLFIPALCFSVGSLYIEPSLNLVIVLGIIFLARYLHKRDKSSILLCLMAFSLALSIKITALPLLIIGYMILIISLFQNKSDFKKDFKWSIYGSLLVIILLSPWIIRNIDKTGYPFGNMPVRFIGLKLGQMTQSQEWYQNQPDLKSYNLQTEIDVLKKCFRSPIDATTNLSILTVVPLFLSIITFFQWLCYEKKIALLWIGICIAVIIQFYHPTFSKTRILWASVNARFLLPLVIPSVVFCFVWCRKNNKLTNILGFYLLSGALVHVFTIVLSNLQLVEKIFIEILIFAFVSFTLLIILKGLIKKYTRYKIIFLSGFIFPILLLIPLQKYRYHTRNFAISQSILFYRLFGFWAPAVNYIDTPPLSWQIAVTSGTTQNIPPWFLYYFLGKNLQNKIYYIPISKDGIIVDYGPNQFREKSFVFDSWYSRLSENKITHVMSFFPKSIELDWMKKKSNLFERLSGDGKSWGLYRVM
jgi:hypothetical protein